MIAQIWTLRRAIRVPESSRSFSALNHVSSRTIGNPDRGQSGTKFGKWDAPEAYWSDHNGHFLDAECQFIRRTIINYLASILSPMTLLAIAPKTITPMCISIKHHKLDVATYAIVKASADTMLPISCFGFLNPCAAPYAKAAMMIAAINPVVDGR